LTHVTIRRCPFCPSIGSQVEGIARHVKDDLSLPVAVEDGAQGELTVLVDGVPVVQKTDEGGLPTTADVEVAIRKAIGVGN
jgi:predicted Rdx family selenoprotein